MKTVLVALSALSLAGPALAQDPSEDWDLTVDAGRQLTLATMDFGANVLALRCQAGSLDLLLTGVPAPAGLTRKARVSAGVIADEEQTWVAQSGQPVLGAEEPARLARQLRGGAELDVRLEPETEGGRSHRYRLPVPASAAAVNAVLTACGQPLEEPRDLLVRVPTGTVRWQDAPRPEYPRAAGSEDGAARLSCVIGPDYRLGDCKADTELPAGRGFGDAAVLAAEGSRLLPPTDGADIRGQLIRFTMRFVSEN